MTLRPDTCLRPWPKTLHFRVLWPFSWAIAHSFGVPGRFKMTARHDTYLRAWPNTRHFCVLWSFSWVIDHSFGVQGRFKMTVNPIHVWCLIKNSSFSCFMAFFMSYWPHFWGSRGIRMAHKTRYMFESYDQKLVVFAFYGRFHELLPIILGFQGDLQVWELWPKIRRFCVL